MGNGASIYRFPPERSAGAPHQPSHHPPHHPRHSGAAQQPEHEVIQLPLEPHSPPEKTAAPIAPPKHWRIDLKWIFGIPCTIVLSLLLAALALFIATGPGNAQQTLASANKVVLAQEFQGDAKIFAPQLYAFLQSPDFARTVYDNPDALSAQVNAVPETQTGPAQGLKTMFGLYAAPLRILNGGTHQTAGILLGLLLVVFAALAVPFMIFSRRLGKVVGMAVSLSIASWVPFLLLSLASGRANSWAAAGNTMTDNGEKALRQVMQPLFGGMFDPALSVYRVGVFLSLSMLAGAALCKLFIRLSETE
ncbi:MAG: hypothetical protein M1539_06050 [Actinobacteria bacterium]|nr:hypothetical protein [Actinomycetota bacterium]MCL5883523.1 hypothetical protein [Actinomycetota bacterium]